MSNYEHKETPQEYADRKQAEEIEKDKALAMGDNTHSPQPSKEEWREKVLDEIRDTANKHVNNDTFYNELRALEERISALTNKNQ